MENLKMTALADGKIIYAPQLVDLSETRCLDGLEHAVWSLFLRYEFFETRVLEDGFCLI